MGKHVFLTVLGGSILAVILGVYLSSFKVPETSHAGYPWEIEVLETGATRVFSLTLGKSTLGEAEQLFKETAELTLFLAEDSTAMIEAFFIVVKIANFKSKMVMRMDVSHEEIMEIYNRGTRIATLGSGTRKVTLSGADAILVRSLPIDSITYLPSAHLDAELIEKRFGIPAEKIADSKSDGVHWLYPEKGLDIVLSEEDKEVIQYVQPKKFDELLQPLKAQESLSE